MIGAKSFWWALASLPLMVVGALGPWAQTFGVRVDGSQDEFVLLLAILAALMLVFLAASERRWLAVIPLLAGLTAAALTGNDIRDIADFAPRVSGRFVSVEWGIYLALLGSMSLVFASVLLLVETSRAWAAAGPTRRLRLARYFVATETTRRKMFLKEAAFFTPYLAVETGASSVSSSVAVEDEGTLFFLPTRQKAGVDRFLKPEWKESRHLQRALDALERVGVEVPRTTFVDVGAHIGTTAITAVRRFGFESALAFEPELGNFRLLRANVGVNGLETAVRTFNVAVSNRVGVAELKLRPRMGSKQRLIGGDEVGANTVRVPLTTLDSVVADGTLDPAQASLLWLDIEGHELEALEGAQRLLERSVPIVMEFIPRGLRREGRLAALGSLLGQHYTHVLDLRLRLHGDPGIRPLDALEELGEQYRRGFTDLLVFRYPTESGAHGDRPERQAERQLHPVEQA
jgi:FkbM family methyltransferase